MATRVITVSTCDRCGDRDERDGAHGGTPPEGWAVATVQWHADRGGGRRELAILCERCADEVDRCIAAAKR